MNLIHGVGESNKKYAPRRKTNVFLERIVMLFYAKAIIKDWMLLYFVNCINDNTITAK